MAKLIVLQFRNKSGEGSMSGSLDGDKRIMKHPGEIIFSLIGPHNIYHDFKESPRPSMPKFLEPQTMGTIVPNQ